MNAIDGKNVDRPPGTIATEAFVYYAEITCGIKLAMEIKLASWAAAVPGAVSMIVYHAAYR